MLRRGKSKLFLWLSILGPGLVVMLADTDSGSLITSAQMGATFGYKLLLQTLILIPILFMAQELTVRLGLFTQRGHGDLIKYHFGIKWAWLSVGTLLVSCVGAMVTEMSGLVGIGNLFHISPLVIICLTIIFLLVLVLTGSYKSVERIAVAIGLFELVFVYIAFKAHPSAQHMWHDVITFPHNTKEYLYLSAANIGAVIMPWMIFYQQSAVVDKGLRKRHLKYARFDTALGAIITQCIMASILIAVAATIGVEHHNAQLNSIGEISQALTPFLGVSLGKFLFALGMLGACLVAAIVVTLTAAWGLGEVLDYRRSLSDSPKEAPWFYSVYALVIISSGVLVSSHLINLVRLNVAVEVMNAILLPVVLGFLYLLARKALPNNYRLKGWYNIFCLIILGSSALFGFFAGIFGA